MCYFRAVNIFFLSHLESLFPHCVFRAIIGVDRVSGFSVHRQVQYHFAKSHRSVDAHTHTHGEREGERDK